MGSLAMLALINNVAGEPANYSENIAKENAFLAVATFFLAEKTHKESKNYEEPRKSRKSVIFVFSL